MLNFRTGRKRKKRLHTHLLFHCLLLYDNACGSLLFACAFIVHNPWTITQSEGFGLQFHFDQSKVRSEIRVRDGRSKPIDVLSKQLNGSDDFDIVINEPYTVFKVNISLVMMLMVVLVHLSLLMVLLLLLLLQWDSKVVIF